MLLLITLMAPLFVLAMCKPCHCKMLLTPPLHMQSMAEMMKRQDREGGKNRTWRGNLRRLQKEVIQLEEDEIALDAVFPQVCPAPPRPACALMLCSAFPYLQRGWYDTVLFDHQQQTRLTVAASHGKNSGA